jgi:DTW domain-containing protein YfiP
VAALAPEGSAWNPPTMNSSYVYVNVHRPCRSSLAGDQSPPIISRVPSISSAKRPLCQTCLRPRSTCICQWITPIEHAVEVVILQHPLEVANAKGSARLLHLSLPHSRLVTGETFDEAVLQALLTAPLQAQAAAQAPRRAILLYPDTPHDPSPDLSAPPVLSPGDVQDPSRLRLIVLDGTWRKSRKMLYQNSQLQQLPRLALRDMPASHYLIRKAHLPDQLSTLEATCAALMQLESCATQFQPLLQAFDGFVAQQMGYRAR